MLKTLKQLRDDIKDRYGKQDQTVVDDNLIRKLINDAIKVIESNINQYQGDNDYFLSEYTFNTVANQRRYALPNNIYANKIRAITDANNNLINKIRQPFKFFKNNTLDNPYYNERVYFLNDDGPPLNADDPDQSNIYTTTKINIIPTPMEVEQISVHYRRECNVMINDHSVCDVPEFDEFIINYVLMEISNIDQSEKLTYYQNQTDSWKELMVSSLNPQVDDGDNEIIPDTSVLDDQRIIYPFIRKRGA